MRKIYDRLAEALRRVIGKDPLSGAIFVFCNGARNRIKVLCIDRGGYWLVARRLEKNTFVESRESARGRVTMRAEGLVLLLADLHLSRFERSAGYERAA